MDRRGPGDLERAVLNLIAAAPEPVTVAEVQRQLPGEPAYTTVMTTLGRMSDKGALRQIRDGRAYRYGLAAAVGSVEDAVTARRMRRLLTDGGDRAGVLARFVAELEPDEEALLLDLLQRSSDGT